MGSVTGHFAPQIGSEPIMQDLTPAAAARLAELAARFGVPVDAATVLLQALAQGNGTQAQFNHPALGGMGQWQPGMMMLGDMFNHGLKAQVDGLCHALAALWREGGVFVPLPVGAAGGFGGNWWPAELGAPSSSGAQNDMAYAYFPAAARLALKNGSQVQLFDTTGFSIFGVSQQQGGPAQTLVFATDRGPMSTLQMPLIA
jgi:hypothetical protein